MEVQLPIDQRVGLLKKDNVQITDTRSSFNSVTKIITIMDINGSDGGTYSMEVGLLDKKGTEDAICLSIQGE